MRSLVVVAAAGILLFAACDRVGSLRLRNESSTTYLSRTSFDSETVLVEEIPPGVDDFAATVFHGFAPGGIELLRRDCSIVAAWPLPEGGGVLVVAPDGSGHFYPEAAEDPSPPPFSLAPGNEGRRLVRSVLQCGATATVPPDER